jgi:hypothetical protein
MKMEIHNSAESVIFTWGRHKGYSIAHVARVSPSYLEWMITKEDLPEDWRVAASKTLSGQDISSLPLPKSIVEKKNTPLYDKKDVKTRVFLVNDKVAAIVMPYDKQLLDRFKYEVDGRIWNKTKKHWEFPVPQLPRVLKLFKKGEVTLDDTIVPVLKELIDRKNDLNEIRKSSNDDYAKILYNLVEIGHIKNWKTVQKSQNLYKFFRKP